MSIVHFLTHFDPCVSINFDFDNCRVWEKKCNLAVITTFNLCGIPILLLHSAKIECTWARVCSSGKSTTNPKRIAKKIRTFLPFNLYLRLTKQVFYICKTTIVIDEHVQETGGQCRWQHWRAVSFECVQLIINYVSNIISIIGSSNDDPTGHLCRMYQSLLAMARIVFHGLSSMTTAILTLITHVLVHGLLAISFSQSPLSTTHPDKQYTYRRGIELASGRMPSLSVSEPPVQTNQLFNKKKKHLVHFEISSQLGYWPTCKVSPGCARLYMGNQSPQL